MLNLSVLYRLIEESGLSKYSKTFFKLNLLNFFDQLIDRS